MDPESVSSELVYARDTLFAKRKLSLSMPSNGTSNPSIQPGKILKVFIKIGHEERVNWSSRRLVSEVHTSIVCQVGMVIKA